MTFGFLILDKPEGMSSAFAGRICKKILNVKKLGHIGTLDPFATGVLPIAVGAATKVIQYVDVSKKTYEFEIKFGEETSTGDKTGNITATSCVSPTIEELEWVLPGFIGEVWQVPHRFSAIKVNGKRAYELARAGRSPALVARKVNIFDLHVVRQVEELVFLLSATVSSGTYIRSLSEDLAKAAGSLGHTVSLKRTKNGKFSIEKAISLDFLREKCDHVSDILLQLENVLDDILAVPVADEDGKNLASGVCVPVDEEFENGALCLARSPGGFCGLVVFRDGFVWPKKIVHF